MRIILKLILSIIIPTISVCFVSENLVTTTPDDIIHVMANDFEKEFHDEFVIYENTNQYSDKLKEMINLLTNELVKNLFVDDIPHAKDPQLCLRCRASTYSFLKFNRTNSNENFLVKLANDLCNALNLDETSVCQGTIATHKPTIKYILEHTKEIQPNRICSIVYQSFNCGTDETLYDDFPVNLEESLPPLKSKISSVINPNNNFTIVHISDVHYDPFYTPGSDAVCKEGICCRGTQGYPNDTKNAAGYWGDYRSCDSPWHTITDVIDQIKLQYKKIDMIYFTGDIIDHFKWLTSIDGNSESIVNMTALFRDAFPGIPLYPVIGNHEAHPANTFAPSNVEGENVSLQWLYDLVEKEWKLWLPESALVTLKKAGYYTVLVHPGFRIVALNNNFCYHTNWWLLHSTTYYAGQLIWFHDTLQSAAEANEKVHILSHIPSNERNCFKPWAREYRKIIEKFANIISGTFNGHSHEDEFNLFYAKNDSSKAVSVAWNGGSATTFAFFNSNFKVYYVDAQSYEVLDFDTWIYNLTEANLTPNKRPNWFKEYSFKDAYQLNDLSPASIDGLVQEFSKDKNKLLTYWHRKVKYSDAELIDGCDNDCLAETLCDIVFTEHGDNTKCDELLGNF